MRALATLLAVGLTLAASGARAQGAWSLPDGSIRTEHDAATAVYTTSALVVLAAIVVHTVGAFEHFCLDLDGSGCPAERAAREPFDIASIVLVATGGATLALAIGLDLDSRSRRRAARAALRVGLGALALVVSF